VKDIQAPEASQNRTVFYRSVIYGSVFLVVWSLRATLLSDQIEGMEPDWLQRLVSDLVRVGLFVLPVGLYVKFLEKRVLFSSLKMPRFPGVRALAKAGGVLGTYLVFTCLVEFVRRGESFQIHVSPLASCHFWVWLFLVAFSEELLFRGVLLQRFRCLLRFWHANLLATLFFVLVHVPYWISHQGMTPDVVSSLLAVGFAGLLFGYVFCTTDSLWCAVIAHAANNFLSVVLNG